MSLEERTLVVRNLDENVTKDLLLELFTQAGPVLNVVLRSNFAYIEFEHKVSVGFALALMQNIALFGLCLDLEPRVRQDPNNYQYLSNLQQFKRVMDDSPDFFLQFMPGHVPVPVPEQPHQRREDNHQRRPYDRSVTHSQHNHRYSDGQQYPNRSSNGQQYQNRSSYGYQTNQHEAEDPFSNYRRRHSNAYNDRKRHSNHSY